MVDQPKYSPEFVDFMNDGLTQTYLDHIISLNKTHFLEQLIEDGATLSSSFDQDKLSKLITNQNVGTSTFKNPLYEISQNATIDVSNVNQPATNTFTMQEPIVTLNVQSQLHGNL